MTGTARVLRHLRHWAETAVALALAVACLYSGARAGLSGAWLGWALAAIGLACALWTKAAFDRARIAEAMDGPGVVSLEEGRVAYFAPEADPDLPYDSRFQGGVVALEDIWSVEAIELKRGAGLAWRLRPVGGGPVVIPVGARGADALPETLSALPGFSVRRAGRAFEEKGLGVRPIWRRGRDAPHAASAALQPARAARPG